MLAVVSSPCRLDALFCRMPGSSSLSPIDGPYVLITRCVADLHAGVCNVPGVRARQLNPVGLHKPASAQGGGHGQLRGRQPQAVQVPLPRPQVCSLP